MLFLPGNTHRSLIFSIEKMEMQNRVVESFTLGGDQKTVSFKVLSGILDLFAKITYLAVIPI